MSPSVSLDRRDRWVIWLGLLATAGLAWIYLFHLARRMSLMPAGATADMTGMPGMDMAATAVLVPWTATDVLLTVAMWAVMMVAMMLPSAAPVVELFAAAHAKRSARGAIPTALFVLAYLVVWGGFSVAAAIAQWRLHAAALLSPMMAASSTRIAGALLIAAGVYQFTPIKTVCLAHCRNPLAFLFGSWREGHTGAFLMGLRHGAYCLGCCWILMALLFVTGVMNLAWVAGLAGFVLLEKVVPAGPLVGRITGFAMAAVGLALLT